MMLTTTASVDLINISMLNAGVVAILGYAVVFFGLILLMAAMMIMGKVFIARDKKLADAKAAKDAQISAIPVAPHTKGAIVVPGHNSPLASGTAGQLKLHDVDPKTAAMVMAIVANKMNKPLNELRFTSIKEVR